MAKPNRAPRKGFEYVQCIGCLNWLEVPIKRNRTKVIWCDGPHPAKPSGGSGGGVWVRCPKDHRRPSVNL